MKKFFSFYIIEAVLIFLSIYVTFAIESYRNHQNKLETKNALLIELSEIIAEDILQIDKILKIQKSCLNDCIDLTNDFLYHQNYKQDSIAAKVLNLSQNMSISFFPQKGIYLQILQTGSLNLIQNKALRLQLSLVYEHFNERKDALNRTIDDFYLRFNQNMANDIVVVSKPSEVLNVVYKGRAVKEYKISSSYYQSNLILSYYSESEQLINLYLDLLKMYRLNFLKIQENIQDEIKG